MSTQNYNKPDDLRIAAHHSHVNAEFLGKKNIVKSHSIPAAFYTPHLMCASCEKKLQTCSLYGSLLLRNDDDVETQYTRKNLLLSKVVTRACYYSAACVCCEQCLLQKTFLCAFDCLFGYLGTI
jgi:hypothetical protein